MKDKIYFRDIFAEEDLTEVVEIEDKTNRK